MQKEKNSADEILVDQFIEEKEDLLVQINQQKKPAEWQIGKDEITILSKARQPWLWKNIYSFSFVANLTSKEELQQQDVLHNASYEAPENKPAKLSVSLLQMTKTEDNAFTISGKAPQSLSLNTLGSFEIVAKQKLPLTQQSILSQVSYEASQRNFWKGLSINHDGFSIIVISKKTSPLKKRYMENENSDLKEITLNNTQKKGNTSLLSTDDHSDNNSFNTQFNHFSILSKPSRLKIIIEEYPSGLFSCFYSRTPKVVLDKNIQLENYSTRKPVIISKQGDQFFFLEES